MPDQNVPTMVYHADWGSDPKKCWLCKAVRDGDTYTAHAPMLVGDHFGFISRMRGEIGQAGTAIVGFDFPVRITARYAELIGATEFKTFLLQLGHSESVASGLGNASNTALARHGYKLAVGVF